MLLEIILVLLTGKKDLQEIQVGYLKELPPDFSEVEVVCSGCPAIQCSDVTAGGSGQ
jgi:hypothetical protein